MKLDSLQIDSWNSSLPKVLLPRQRRSLPSYQIDWKRLRPLWLKVPVRSLKLLLDPVIFWWVFGTYEGDPIRFDLWQIAWLRDHSRYRAAEKAPQIGWSWTCALEALHEALMFMDSTSGFVSVDQREASEKILYARKAYSELPGMLQDWLPLVKDSVEELHIGESARPSRILSIPSTAALRGRRMSVYLDEVDFYKDGAAGAFRVALGRITRGGRISMGSTVFGEGTQLDRVMRRNSDDKEARNFSVCRLPWTVVSKPEMLASIKIALEELEPEAAAEEYGCIRGGDTADTFPADLLRRQQHDGQVFSGSTQDLRNLWRPVGKCVAGYDVGLSRNPSVLSVLEWQGDRWEQVVLHSPRTDRDSPMSLPQQEALLDDLLRAIPTLTLVLDVVGIGASAGQSLQAKYGSRVISMSANSKPPGMPSQMKNDMVVEVKKALEGNELTLAPDRDQALQFRRTRFSPLGSVEQEGSRRRTHYDLFWATTYAWYGTRASGRVASIYEHRDLMVI